MTGFLTRLFSRDLHKDIGRRVEIAGEAADAKAAAIVRLSGGGHVYLDGVHFWPKEIRGKQVKAIGTLRLEPAPEPAGAGEPAVQQIGGESWWLADPSYEVAR
jgi:hypothetical protein